MNIFEDNDFEKACKWYQHVKSNVDGFNIKIQTLREKIALDLLNNKNIDYFRSTMYGIHASPPLFWFSNSNFKCRICSIFAYSPKFLCKSFISLQPLTFPFPIDKIIMDRIKNHKKSHKLLWSFYGQSMPLWTVAVFYCFCPTAKSNYQRYP